MRLLPFLVLFAACGAIAAPIPVNLAQLGTGVEVRTDSQLLESDVRDAVGGLFSRAEPGNVVFADRVQAQGIVLRFPQTYQVRTVVVEVVPRDPARMPERVDLFASAAEEGDTWQVVVGDPRPSGSPLVYEASGPVPARRIRLDLGSSDDGVGARILEVKVYAEGRDVLYPSLTTPPHWTAAAHPGRVALDAWGWQGPITLQRASQRGEGFDYFREHIIDEAYEWGANLFELYPPNLFPTSWPFEWGPDDPIERPPTYPYWNDPRWQQGTLRTLTRYAHSKGMLVHWFCHPEMVPMERGEPTFFDPGKIAQNVAALRKIGSDYSNGIHDSWEDLFDAFGHEHWFLDGTGATARAGWEWNPGMTFYSTGNWRPFPEPAYTKGLAAGSSWVLRGRDDQWLLPSEKGVVPLALQADARTRRPPEEIWGSWSRLAGGTYPDWMVKQANDFARRRHCADERPDASALWWLGEPESTLPEEYRPYVYGTSQDPMRCAVTTQLRTTGAMGHMDIMGRLYASEIGRRYDLPATTWFIQNNYLRLYRDPTSDLTVLVYDPTRTAHFDEDSDSRVLASDLARLEVEGGPEAGVETVWQLGNQDGSAAEFRPRFDMLVGRSEPFDPREYVSAGHPVLSVGLWDGESSELLPEGGFRDQEFIEVQESVTTRFPRLLGAPPRGPSEVVLRVPLQAGWYRLELSQQRNAVPDQVMVLVDGSPRGRLDTLDTATVEEQGFANALHRVEPIAIARDGVHEIALGLLNGDGFEIDAVRLVYTAAYDRERGEPKPYGTDEFVHAGKTPEKEAPAGVGREAYAYPVNFHLMSSLEPGTYSLRVAVLPGEEPTYARLFLGEDHIGALVSGKEPSEVAVPFCVATGGVQDLRISAEEGSGCEFDFLALDRLSGITRSFEVVEPAGHLAVLQETVTAPTEKGPVVETRRFALASDSPVLHIAFDRSGPGNERATTVFGADQYQSLSQARRESPEAPVLAAWRGEGLPDLGLRVQGSPATASGEQVRVAPPDGGRFEATLVLLDGLYQEGMVAGLPSGFGSEGLVPERRLAGASGLVEENGTEVPQVRVIRIMNPAGSPYYVEESGADGSRRWVFRGAEPSHEILGTDLLKLYLPPGGKARVVPDGLIDGIARPGWGCQYLLALGELARSGSKASFTADVFSVTPFVFSPRVEVAGPVREVLLDGRPYQYFDGNQVLLPNRRATYRVEVTLGRPESPHLTRTCAVVEEAKWDAGRGSLAVRAVLPEWCPTFPDGMTLAALVNLEGRKPENVSGGILAREEGDRAVIWYRDSFEVTVR